jgi:NAD(P)-dependent dehydrogenase (short-subunit alcohol dehydrogenase family)
MAEKKERSVLITGCSSGIGLCTAEGLQRRGYRVFATARQAADVDMLQDRGLESLQLDLDDSASIHTAVDEILQRTGGKLYALFNNGAYGQPGAVEDLARDVLRQQFETNFFGTFELTNRILPVLRRQGYGRLLFNSSVLGFAAMPYRGAYNASKFAMEGLCDTLRLELSGTGIHVALIEPGPITSRFRNNAFKAFMQNIDRHNSVHRDLYAQVEERLQKEGPAAPFTLGPEAVLARVVHALEARRPKIRYYVTVPTYLFAWLRHVLPYRAMDWLQKKAGA